jgi:hypothetical protein
MEKNKKDTRYVFTKTIYDREDVIYVNGNKTSTIIPTTGPVSDKLREQNAKGDDNGKSN